MRDDDGLKAGVDKPTIRQYVIGVLVIVGLALGTYWWLTHHRR